MANSSAGVALGMATGVGKNSAGMASQKFFEKQPQVPSVPLRAGFRLTPKS